ncbi:MAG: pyridoxine 5'-phosphate synthase [Bacteroidetes bacterium]|nr:pyridoxine 5'-phosphate synthase [Bacteroidota bacterium]
MTKLSVNINKIATIRNARGGNMPDIVKAAIDCQNFGADGITVHPRPDQRHIRYNDVLKLKDVIFTEFNIEGNPQPDFIDLVLKTKPHQVTLVPDSVDAITSNAGWDTIKNKIFLTDVIKKFKDAGIRVSVFLDPVPEQVIAAKETGTDRIELYTENYAENFGLDRNKAIEDYVKTAEIASKIGLGVNAGHDLNLENLNFFYKNIQNLEEVSIGHALICDSLYYGLQNTIQMYKAKLK